MAKLVLVFPLTGFALNGLMGGRCGRRGVGAVGVGAVGLAFVCAAVMFVGLVRLGEGGRTVTSALFPWITVGQVQVTAQLLIDPLSVLMAIVVSGVSFLIHIYSTAYMEEDANFSRFFAYLNLFTFSMLLLVLAGNFLVMFVGWEGVGLCSYLLIGFWFERESAARAGNKAFIVNRIGDCGFLVGIILIFTAFGTLEFTEVFRKAPNAHNLTPLLANLIPLLLFLGAVGKSAQIPLYVWLPDAMEGPTPVSALIHAATMVTAGVYMVARCHVLYLLAPPALLTVAIVGILTAIYAASIGLVQNDIKRVLAYSTISQLGYMFLGCGVGAFSASIFHLMTHAFFKALLFLAAGSVLHALAEEHDMRRMGGLYPRMKATAITFWVAALALSALPPLSGFFSKEEILGRAFAAGRLGETFWAIGVITGEMTAFYVARLGLKTFHGDARWKPDVAKEVHESPLSMVVPMSVLAVLSVLGGLLGMPRLLGGSDALGRFLEPVFSGALVRHAATAPFLEITLMVGAVAVSLGGILAAGYLYVWRPEWHSALKERLRGLYGLLSNKYYVDEGYAAGVIRPAEGLANFVSLRLDMETVDGAVNGIAALVNRASLVLRRWQTGLVRNYALTIFFAIMLVLLYSLLR